MKKDTIPDNLISSSPLPTLADLRMFFRSHDWSASSLSSPSSRSPDKQSDMEYVKRLLDSQFEQSARSKGMKAPSKYYAKDNSLIVLRDNVEDLISDAVTSLDEETVSGILSQFNMSDPELEEKSDSFLKNAVDTMLDIMDYSTVAKIVQDNSLPEDYNGNVSPNYRKMDAERRIYHTREKEHAEANPDPDANRKLGQTNIDVEKTVEYRAMMSEFMNSLNDTDRKIFSLYSKGYTQKEIAEELGCSNNGAVSKRIKHIKETLADVYARYR